ncbi:RNA polymerase ECF-type sigma factor [gut metagenome]|uniref:RNA polymerase ECF-type sigma factor n=1 Tax=gut metagenome TaxID=749906 RepID=J9GJM7_9ZZZZ
METKEKLFLEMIQQHEQTIYTICYMFSQDQDEVNDLYQDILLQLWQGYDTFEGRSDIRTWIYRVSLNYCINFQRKQKREREQKELLPRWNPDESLERKLQVKQLYQRINALGLVDRSVVLLWLEGLSYEEIAAIIGISVKNVSFKLVRIKEQLKSMSNHKKNVGYGKQER